MLVALESANWKIDEGMILMQNWLVKYPDLGLVFTANDIMALGVINALREMTFWLRHTMQLIRQKRPFLQERCKRLLINCQWSKVTKAWCMH